MSEKKEVKASTYAEVLDLLSTLCDVQKDLVNYDLVLPHPKGDVYVILEIWTKGGSHFALFIIEFDGIDTWYGRQASDVWHEKINVENVMSELQQYFEGYLPDHDKKYCKDCGFLLTLHEDDGSCPDDSE